ncbi:MAG: hypothetical protein E7117_04270 [Bacteroidales bacterium]|nr:hypothetical protein [Bacteroidales bacterium]
MIVTDEITDLLQKHGMACQVERYDGFDMIKTSGGRTSRTIISVHICACSRQEAEYRSEQLASFISQLTSGHPVMICEDRWIRQNKMTVQRLLAHFNIFTQVYARNCETRKIDKKTARDFLQANHSYGNASCRHQYGLYLRRHTGHNSGKTGHIGELIAVATFSNARKWIKGDKTIRSYEWTRYASLPDMRVNGGMGKLLKAFIADVNPDDIMTYADLEWSEGKVYEELGFTLEGHKKPVTFTIDRKTWIRTDICHDPASTDGSPDTSATSIRFFTNSGSNKYRLKLTDYQ